MSGLDEILQTIKKEFRKVKERRWFVPQNFVGSQIVSSHRVTEEELFNIRVNNQVCKIQQLPKKIQGEILKKFSVLWEEYQNFPITGDKRKYQKLSLGDKRKYQKLLGTLEWIIHTQERSLFQVLKSYEQHLKKTKPTNKKSDVYRIWDEKRILTKKAILALLPAEKSFNEVKEDLLRFSKYVVLKDVYKIDVQKENINTQWQSLCQNFENRIKSVTLGTSIGSDLKDLDRFDPNIFLKNQYGKIKEYMLETQLTAIQNTLTLFADRDIDNLKTGFEILEQEKDGWFAKLIIDFVNFFRTIGVQNLANVEAIKQDTQWQFWKKNRHEVISEVKKSVLNKQESDQDTLGIVK